MDNYLVFVLASIILCIVPGPDMIFLLSCTLARGRKAGILAAMGINAGAYVHLVGAVLGLSALLAASAYAFTILKWAGALYLIYIGIQTLRSKTSAVTIEAGSLTQKSGRQIFWQGFLSDVLNPKVAIFFLAFLPQFVSSESEHQTRDIFFLGITVNVIAILINIVLVYMAALLTNRLRASQKISNWLNKIMGSVFILLGLKLANEKI